MNVKAQLKQRIGSETICAWCLPQMHRCFYHLWSCNLTTAYKNAPALWSNCFECWVQWAGLPHSHFISYVSYGSNAKVFTLDCSPSMRINGWVSMHPHQTIIKENRGHISLLRSEHMWTRNTSMDVTENTIFDFEVRSVKYFHIRMLRCKSAEMYYLNRLCWIIGPSSRWVYKKRKKATFILKRWMGQKSCNFLLHNKFKLSVKFPLFEKWLLQVQMMRWYIPLRCSVKPQPQLLAYAYNTSKLACMDVVLQHFTVWTAWCRITGWLNCCQVETQREFISLKPLWRPSYSLYTLQK